MPVFYFDIRGGSYFNDADGTVLPDAVEALEHGRLVAADLMRNCERGVRHWRILVRDEAGDLVSEILFASVDPTLNHLKSELRSTIERVSSSLGELRDAVRDARMTTLENRALRAGIRKKPSLVAIGGRTLSTAR
jgi:hypothetical protein